MKVIWIYVCMCVFPIIHLYKILNIVPYAKQQVLVYLFYL